MQGKPSKASKTKTLVAVICATCLLAAVLGLSVGCSPQQPAPSTGGNSSASQTDTADKNAGAMENQPVDWSMQSDCATCHTTEAEGVSDTACVQAVAHEAQGLTCVQCHTDETVLQASHGGVTYGDKPASKPSVITVDPQTCISCHGDLDAVASLTANSEALKDSNGTVVNPHERPAGQKHEENPATCTDCHNNHSKDLSKDAMKYCAQCHHRGIFQCGTCHEIRERSAS